VLIFQRTNGKRSEIILWLKDRHKAKGTLSFDDVLHYQKVVVALKETMQLMGEIDQLIPSFPIE
jgi:hypothetical protein